MGRLALPCGGEVIVYRDLVAHVMAAEDIAARFGQYHVSIEKIIRRENRAQLHTSTSGRTMFELWSWVLMPGDVFAADAHSPDTRELLSVTQGSINVRVGGHEILLNAGESARLVTDQPHSYAAASDVPAHFSMAVLERGGQRVPAPSSQAAKSPVAVSQDLAGH